MKKIYIFAIGGAIIFVLYASGFFNRFLMRQQPLPQYRPNPMAGPIPRGNISLPMKAVMTPMGPMYVRVSDPPPTYGPPLPGHPFQLGMMDVLV